MKADITLQDATEKLRKRGHQVGLLPGPDGLHVAVGDYQYTSLEVIFLVQHGLKPGTKIWYRVVFDSDIPETEATGVMTGVVKAYREAGLPEGVEVFRAPASEKIVYYFSPQAASLLPRGTRADATPCVKPDVTQMRKAEL